VDVSTLRARLAALDTPAVSDARDRLGLPNGVAYGLRRLAGDPALSGNVVTIALEPITAGADPVSARTRHLGTAAVDACGPGDVMVVAHGGRTTMAGWGGVLSAAASVRGIEGVIIDGAARDVDEAIDLSFPIYAMGAVPVTARGRVRERDWNVPIEVCGIAVAPGDWVIADSSGVVFIEAAHAEQVVSNAEVIVRAERAMVERVNHGVAVSEVMGAPYETFLEDM
jgi:4-hydroxy-4-methyl-2-oxoglutarate aldolase